MIQATQRKFDCVDTSLARGIFGDVFQVWTNDRGWRRIDSACDSATDNKLSEFFVAEQLESQSDLTVPKYVPVTGARVLCLLPLSNSHVKTVAVQVVDAGSPALLELVQRASTAAFAGKRRSENLHSQLREKQNEVGILEYQRSRDDAEREWLHDLTRHAELNEKKNDPILVAQTILPRLRNILCARAIVFVRSPCGAQVDNVPVNSWQTGPERIPDYVLRALIKDVGSRAGEQAIVENYQQPVYQSTGFAGVLSVIVKAVSRPGRNSNHVAPFMTPNAGTTSQDDNRSGWIIAVNRDLKHVTDSISSAQSALVMDEAIHFGAFEDGLICAAANALSAHARNSSLLSDREVLVSGTIRSLVNAIDAKDSYTCGHSDRVAEFARQIAVTMQLDEEFCERIYMTGLLHDVGKIGIPDSVLQKPDTLSPAEFEQIKAHPIIGHRILKHLSGFDYVLPGVLYHHEAVDGTGYPHGLQGDEIPLDARILAVADAYDAMTSDRPYRNGMPSERAEAIIAEGAGKQWDAECVTAFQKCISGLRLIAANDQQRNRQIDKPLVTVSDIIMTAAHDTQLPANECVLQFQPLQR